MQAQLKNSADLPFGKLVSAAFFRVARLNRLNQRDILRDIADGPFLLKQLGPRNRRIGRTADHRHNLVQIGHSNHQSEQDVRAITRLVQLKLRPPRYDLFTELDEGLNEFAQSQRFGPAPTNGEHVGGEARLRGRVAPQLVEHHIRCGITLQIDHHAHAGTR